MVGPSKQHGLRRIGETTYVVLRGIPEGCMTALRNGPLRSGKRREDLVTMHGPRVLLGLHPVVPRVVFHLGQVERFDNRRDVHAKAAAETFLEAVPTANRIL